MKVSEFIDWLKTQDQDAIVEVLAGYRGLEWQQDWYSVEKFDQTRHSDYVDLRENHFAKGVAHKNRRSLFLGHYE